MTRTKVIFFGNGALADWTKLTLLRNGVEIVFHARKTEDLEKVKELKRENPELHGILASFGVMIKSDVLELFEPEGILNIHPSLLPDLRGPSPIETAILRGDNEFSVSVMKLVKKMDAGPIYFQTTLKNAEIIEKTLEHTGGSNSSPPNKSQIYQVLAVTGAEWLASNIENLPSPVSQDPEGVTFSEKLSTALSELKPQEKPATRLLNEIRAFEKFPKSRFSFFGVDCIIHSAHISETEEPLSLKCSDGKYLCIDTLQPAGKKIMDSKSFLNGYKR